MRRMSERLYYGDSFLTRFLASVTDAADDGHRVYLSKTAFYPTSGGQPQDRGTLNEIAVIDVVEEDGRIAHVLEKPLAVGAVVAGVVDWTRRHDHMQQHSGQHLLSGVLFDLYGIHTLSFHLGEEISTIEIDRPSLSAEQIAAVEQRGNELIWEGRPVQVHYEDAELAVGLRKASEREGTLRIVSISGLDRSACGGTHVTSTAQIGMLSIRRLDKVRGNVRIEFLCGLRALKRARADLDCLNAAARLFSSSLDAVPELIAALQEKAKDSEKTARKLALDLAVLEGARKYQQAATNSDGVRFLEEHHGELDETVRAVAQSFTSGSRAVYLGVSETRLAVLYAVSADQGSNAGQVLKAALQAVGGRGGGAATLAQGSVPDRAALDNLLERLRH
jgi:alanyl-tRNA synthetase